MDYKDKQHVKQKHSQYLEKVLEFEPHYNRLLMIVNNRITDEQSKNLIIAEMKDILEKHTDLSENIYMGAVDLLGDR